LTSEEEEVEGRASYLPGEMRSLSKGAHNKRTRAVAMGAYDEKRSGW